jgi:anti-anti-sigma factor
MDSVPADAAPSHVGARTLGDGTAVVTLSGAIDARAVGALEDAFALVLEPHLRRLVVDLSGATLLDSMALGALVYAAKRTAAGGGRLEVSGARPNVRRVLRVGGLDRALATAQ